MPSRLEVRVCDQVLCPSTWNTVHDLWLDGWPPRSQELVLGEENASLRLFMMNNTTNNIALILQTAPFVFFIAVNWNVQNARRSPVRPSLSSTSLASSTVYLLPSPSQANNTRSATFLRWWKEGFSIRKIWAQIQVHISERSLSFSKPGFLQNGDGMRLGLHQASSLQVCKVSQSAWIPHMAPPCDFGRIT